MLQGQLAGWWSRLRTQSYNLRLQRVTGDEINHNACSKQAAGY
jgi:hypothetical protein